MFIGTSCSTSGFVTSESSVDELDCDIESSSFKLKFDGEAVDDSVEMEILSLKLAMLSTLPKSSYRDGDDASTTSAGVAS